jgi:predicted lipid-binding transport protein (Tim44 family)
MFRSRWFRLSALFAVLLTLFSLSAVDLAEARMGGSFGSRGMRTYQTVPSTQTVPGVTGPVQRSMNTPSVNNGYGAPYARPGLFGNGLGGWLLGGLLFSGLFGMMFGGGFGGFGGIFSLLIQFAILFFVLRWVFRRFGGQAASAGPGLGGGNSNSYGNTTYNYAGSGQQSGSSPGSFGGLGRGTSEASRRAAGRDEVGVGDRDLQSFEQRLSQLQDAYSREDYDALRKIATPEVMSYLTEELAQAASQGLRNEVFDVKLLSGDIAEAWREGSDEYATVALKYESRDVMRERATGKLVSGEDRVIERAEVWTFVRHNRGDWLISAIQGA